MTKTKQKPMKKTVKKTEKETTPKQKKLIKLIVENLGNPKGTKTLKTLIKQAGYSDSMAKNPHQIFASTVLKKELSTFTDEMQEKRQKALKHMTDAKLKKASAKDLISVINGFTKDIELLSGGVTERIGDELPSKRKKVIADILEDNK